MSRLLPRRWRIGLARMLIRKADDLMDDMPLAEAREILLEPIEERIAWITT